MSCSSLRPRCLQRRAASECNNCTVWPLGFPLRPRHFRHRRSQSELLILAQWSNPAETERHVGWARAFFEAMQPFAASGVYVNDLGQEGEERVRAAYGANYDRLAAVKAAYDPINLFRSNQNVRPTA